MTDNKQILHELVDKLPLTDIERVINFIGYLIEKREKEIVGSIAHNNDSFPKDSETLIKEEVQGVLEQLKLIKIDSKQAEMDLEREKAREYSLHERANMVSSAFEQGRQQGLNLWKYELVKKLYLAGVDIETIAETTGLDKKQIESLK